MERGKQAHLDLSEDAPVLTARVGENSDLLPAILALYVPEGSRIADVTWGRGAFWEKVDRTRYHVDATDLATDGIDFRALPYEESSLDALILDPPYMAGGAGVKRTLNDCYQNEERTRSPADVRRLYGAGILEAARVLRPDGILIVKCQDAVESHRQELFHMHVTQMLDLFGFRVEDMFVLVQRVQPLMRHVRQMHARKNHSYAVVGRRCR